MNPADTAATTTATATKPITSALRDFYGQLAGTTNSGQAAQDITTFNKTAPTTGNILSAFDTQYGVDAARNRVGELRKSVMNAEDLVRNVDDNVFARTSNALVSDSQRARLTAGEKDPLLKQLDITNRSFDLASGDLQGAQEQSNRFSGAEIGDISTMRQSLSERLTTTQQREAAEAAARQQEEENRRWWENFNTQKAQFEQDMAIKRRSLDAQIAASKASTNNLLAQIKAMQQPAPAKSLPTVAAPVANRTINANGGSVGQRQAASFEQALNAAARR